MKNKLKNIPYKKQYDENGVLLNPIERAYINPFPNRQLRKSISRGDIKYSITLKQLVKTDYRDKLIVLRDKYIKSFKKFKDNIDNIIENGLYKSKLMQLNSLYGQFRAALYKGSANKHWI